MSLLRALIHCLVSLVIELTLQSEDVLAHVYYLQSVPYLLYQCFLTIEPTLCVKTCRDSYHGHSKYISRLKIYVCV